MLKKKRFAHLKSYLEPQLPVGENHFNFCNLIQTIRITISQFNPLTVKLFNLNEEERDMAQWLERGALSMSLPAVRFRIPLGAGFSEKYHVSPLSILEHC